MDQKSTKKQTAKSKAAEKPKIVNGKPVKESKPLIDHKYKSFFNTMVFIIILIIFFIVNNTRKEPDRGPYPPFYKQGISFQQK